MNEDTPGAAIVGRREIITEVVEALGGGGALLVGESGIGKTALANAALQRLSEDVYVVHARGSVVSTKTAYGALAFLLSELDDEAMSHPALLLDGLTGVLTHQANGRRIIMFVDNADEIDSLAAMVITQLAYNGTVTLLITASDASAAGEELMHLWIDGHLKRFDLGPLQFEDAAELMRITLGGRLSDRAARTLWTATGGNPHHLQVMTREQATVGSLVVQDGVWVLAKPIVPSGAIADVVRARLHRLSPARRRLLEILSFAEELPMDIMRALTDPADVDALEELSVLEVVPSPYPTVRMRNHLTAEVIRHTVPIGRSRELWDEVMAVVEVAKIPAGSVMGFASWGLMCGAPLDAQTGLRAARLANQLQDPVNALRYIDGLPHRRRCPEVVLEEVRALTALGDYATANEALEEVRATEDCGQLHIWVPLMIERSRVLRALPERPADPAAVLAEASAVVAAAADAGAAVDSGAADAGAAVNAAAGPPYSQAQLRELQDRLSVAAAEVAAFDGRYGGVADGIFAIYAERRHRMDLRVLAGSLLCEAWSHTGLQQEAVDLAGHLMDLLEDPEVSRRTREVVYGRVFSAYSLAGMLSTCAGMLDVSGVRGLRSTSRSAGGDLAAGLLHLHCGRSDDALDSLLPAVSELKVRDPEGSLPLALAATAYAYALQDEHQKARHYLETAAPATHRTPWYTRRAAMYCRQLATAAERPRQEVVAELVRHAEEDLELGNISFALFFLSAAARLGDIPAAERLADTAGKAQGLFAQLCEKFGTGLVHDDGQLLLEAARLAQEAGNCLFCYEAAQAAHTAASRGQDRVTMREARKLENSSYRQLRHTHSISYRIGELSQFDLDLATRAAGGDSSAAIGKDLHLSPRTVDWHLGKIFEKLHVSGRAELKEALG